MRNKKIILHGLTILLILISCEKGHDFEYPLVYTGDVTNITDTNALFSAKISFLGDYPILESGFIWGVHSKDNNGIKIKNPENVSGIYSLYTNEKLLPGKTFYVRGYVQTENTTSYESLAATFQLHNKLSPRRIFSHCKIYLEISPTIGFSAFSSSNELYVVHETDKIPIPTTCNDFYYGFNGSTGIECAFTQAIGMLISYSLQYNRVQSILYSDDHFTVSQLNVGFFIKLKKDKRFFYRS
jgi:hypothetical protein